MKYQYLIEIIIHYYGFFLWFTEFSFLKLVGMAGLEPARTRAVVYKTTWLTITVHAELRNIYSSSFLGCFFARRAISAWAASAVFRLPFVQYFNWVFEAERIISTLGNIFVILKIFVCLEERLFFSPVFITYFLSNDERMIAYRRGNVKHFLLLF